MANKERVVYFNGEFVPESEAKISIYDSSLMFGDMVFEMMRTFHGKQWRLREHLERLYSGLKILRIPIEMKIDEMEKAVYETVEKNQASFSEHDEHRVLIDVSRGLLSIYQDIVGVPSGVNVVIADFPVRWTISGSSHLYDSGINLVDVPQKVIPSSLMEPKIKNRSRIFYLMGNIQASLIEGKDNWPILMDMNNFLAEGTGSNFFLVKDGIIYTPEPRDILRGITRQTIIDEIAPALNLKVIEKNLESYDLYEADEAFMTSTPFCLLPATTYNKIPIGNGKPGEITNMLLKKWSEIVDLDIVKQIKDWDNLKDGKDPDAPSPYKFK